MKFPPFAKAIVAAVIAGAAPAGTSAVTTGGVDGKSLTASVITALLGGLATYFVPNGASKNSVGGLTVTLKTDVDAFLKAFLAGLPTLIKSAAQTAIQPKVDQYPPAAPAAPVEPPVTPGVTNG